MERDEIGPRQYNSRELKSVICFITAPLLATILSPKPENLINKLCTSLKRAFSNPSSRSQPNSGILKKVPNSPEHDSLYKEIQASKLLGQSNIDPFPFPSQGGDYCSFDQDYFRMMQMLPEIRHSGYLALIYVFSLMDLTEYCSRFKLPCCKKGHASRCGKCKNNHFHDRKNCQPNSPHTCKECQKLCKAYKDSLKSNCMIKFKSLAKYLLELFVSPSLRRKGNLSEIERRTLDFIYELQEEEKLETLSDFNSILDKTVLWIPRKIKPPPRGLNAKTTKKRKTESIETDMIMNEIYMQSYSTEAVPVVYDNSGETFSQQSFHDQFGDQNQISESQPSKKKTLSLPLKLEISMNWP